MFQSEDVIMLKWIIINKVEDNEEREQTGEFWRTHFDIQHFYKTNYLILPSFSASAVLTES